MLDKIRGFGGQPQELALTEAVAAFGLEPAEDGPRRAANAALAIRALAAGPERGRGRPDVKVALHTQPMTVVETGRPWPSTRKGAPRGGRRWPRCWSELSLVASWRAGRPAGSLGRASTSYRCRATDGMYRLAGQADPALAAFVGRDRELALLAERFEQVQSGQGQMVVIVGEAGIGKSRLLSELRRRLAGSCTWAEGHALAFGRSLPFHPVIEMVHRTYRMEETDPEAVVIEKLEPRILRLGEDLRPTLPFLRYLLSVDPGDPGSPADGRQAPAR